MPMVCPGTKNSPIAFALISLALRPSCNMDFWSSLVSAHFCYRLSRSFLSQPWPGPLHQQRAKVAQYLNP